jgi:uncharacterized membrane protein
MSKPAEFISETIKGGIFFVIPLTVVLVILAKTHAMLQELTAPIASLLPKNILGLNGGFLIALIGLILACFLGGLLIKSAIIKQRIDVFEEKYLSRIPGYSFIKATASDTFGDGSKSMQAVMIRDDVSFMLGLIIEQNDTLCTVFVPGSPNATSGEIKIFEIKDVIPINVKAKDVITSLSRLGKGSNQWLLDAQSQFHKTEK